MDQGQTELEALRDIPGFKAIMRALIKSQMKYLAEEMKHHIGEETLVLSASVVEGTMSHIGTEAGREFLHMRDDIKSQFQDHCLKKSKSRGDVLNSSQIQLEYIDERKQVPSYGFSVNAPDGKRKHPIDHSNNELECALKKTRYRVPEKPVSTDIISSSDAAKCIPSQSFSSVRSSEKRKSTLCKNKTVSSDIQGESMSGNEMNNRNMDNEEHITSVALSAENSKRDSGDTKHIYNSLLSSKIDSRNTKQMENSFLSKVTSKVDSSSTTEQLEHSLPSVSKTMTDTSLDVTAPCCVKVEPFDDVNDEIQIEEKGGSIDYNYTFSSEHEDQSLNSSSDDAKQMGEDNMLYYVIVKGEEETNSDYKGEEETNSDYKGEEETNSDYKGEEETNSDYKGEEETNSDYVIVKGESSDEEDTNNDTSLLTTNVSTQGPSGCGSLNIQEWELPIENKHTRKKTESDVRKFRKYLLSKNEDRPWYEIDHDTLDHYIADFITNLRKPDGVEYELNSLRAIVSSLDRLLLKHNNPLSIMKGYGGQYSLTRNALKEKQLSLELLGKGNRYRAAAKLTDSDINTLYEKRVLSLDNPGSLLNTLWLNNCIGFQLAGSQEHCKLRWGDISLKTRNDGVEYLELNTQQLKERFHEDASTTEFAPRKIYSTYDERDPIRAYKLYRLKRPNDFCEDSSPFYLTPVTRRVYVTDLYHEPWYFRTQLSERKIFAFLKTMARDAGLLHFKHITNHSATKLTQEKVKDFLKQNKRFT